MPFLKIRHFGPIVSFDFKVSRFNILIGKQACGKSTVAKLLFYFEILPYVLATFSVQHNNAREYEKFLAKLETHFWNLFEPQYCFANSEIRYHFFDGEESAFVELYMSTADSGAPELHVAFDEQTRSKIESYLKKYAEGYVDEHDFDSSLESAVFKSVKDADLYQESKDEAKRIFNMPQTPLFMPASRSHIFLQLNQMSEVDVAENDRITSSFISALKMYRRICANGLEAASLQIPPAGLVAAMNPQRVQIAQNLIEAIIRGRYKCHQNDDRIYLDGANGLYTSLQNASSGQQEALGILLIVYGLILRDESVFLTVEEPEAHLYPEAQDAVTRLFVLLHNTSINSRILITTHSPYVLTSLNNLLAAHQYGSQNANMQKIVEPSLWLDEGTLSAYLLDGVGEDIVDKELVMIRSEKIDSASSNLNMEYEKILDAGEL